MNKKIFLKLYNSFIVFCLVLLMIAPSFSEAPIKIAEAAGPTFDVEGYAWSWHPHEQGSGWKTMSLPNITVPGYPSPTMVDLFGDPQTGTQGFGWISMSGTNPNSGGGNYKVQIDPVTGKFSGYAWSENGGWVNFAPTGPYPSAAGTTAQSAFVDPVCLADKTQKCTVKGWIRFVEGTTGNSSWDGWVNMEIFNDAAAAAPYYFDYSIPLGARASGVKILPEAAGYRPLDGYAWGDDMAGIIGFSKTKIKLADVCRDTTFAQTSNPKNTGIDPLTVGTQTTIPKGYTIKTIDGVEMCGIFGCTDKTAVNYVKNATVDDNSCIPKVVLCPDGTKAPNGNIKECPEEPTCTPKSETYNPISGLCEECHPGVKDYNAVTGLCEPIIVDPTCPDGSVIPPNGICPGVVDQCQNVNGIQLTVDAPYTQVIESGVKNCYIIGCTDPHATASTYNPAATMQDSPSSCQYDPGVEICGNKKDDDGDGKINEGCPNFPVKRKTPVYIES